MSDIEPIIERVLLTNDDGIDAPGLAVLEAVAAELAHEVWVVAPERDQSGTSHSISLHSPLRIAQRGERHFSVHGTPGDCVVMAVRHLMKEATPTLVLSGINRGANLGVETMFSGTVGAAMTGLLLGLPSIALSQAVPDRKSVRWDTARALAPAVLRRLLSITHNTPTCLNVNFPDCDASEAGPLAVTQQGTGYFESIDVFAHIDPRGIDYHWMRFQHGRRPDAPDTEAAIISARGISVTPIHFDRTAQQTVLTLQAGLEAGATV
ncbi:5'/3'-nucleotidase SurE [Paraburkholderia sp. UYCP14C]|uniref:5'/3'-nucleotidase SurE n=1 Tax=Paraburkholderia sp. UYCP14C TaxID=2511130 RepID=UPI0010218C34|nr:5'/3'-nucleotidase SurE [Paraburkholderia sp. UYCP14C]RZF25715.1 5'/3'-nucleotidase SurE [Paraburkholderia sp. UYCP14C]